MSVYYNWKTPEMDDRPEKPRRFGVTEMSAPQYTLMGKNVLEDIFLSAGEFVDGLKFSGGSHSLMPKSFVKEVIDMAHQHNIYVSTGDWAEHVLHRGPSAFNEYLKDCKELGFDTIELNAGSLRIPEENLLRYIRLIKNCGLKAKPLIAFRFYKSEIPAASSRAFGAYVPTAPKSDELVEDENLMIRMAERCLEAGADMIMIDGDDHLRGDVIAKLINRLGLEKTMFETKNAKTSEWFIQRYGPKVNLFVDYSQVMNLECLRGFNFSKRNISALGSSYYMI